MFITDYLEQKYNQTFEAIYNYMKKQKETDENYTLHDLEKFLENLYANQGDNWIGRGESKEIANSATIAACELLLAQWKMEASKNL